MGLHRFRRGLDLPITGAPEQTIHDAPAPREVAVVAPDYPGMRPTMHVNEGDAVRVGQLLFEDKKNPGVRYTSPGAGTVVGVNRGAKRALQSVVVRLDGTSDAVSFDSFTNQHPSALTRQQVTELLVESGQWPALRARPFAKVAVPGSEPKSIFVTAADSHPLAPDLATVAAGRGSDLERGLHALLKLTDGQVHFCQDANDSFEVPNDSRISVERFSGPHPAGTAGLHIHTLDPVDRNKLVWQIGLQDLLMIGKLFGDGTLDVSRVVALGGPRASKPRLLRTRLGAKLDDLTQGETNAPKTGDLLNDYLDASQLGGNSNEVSIREVDGGDKIRTISGSVLNGRAAEGDLGYLGRYHQAVALLTDDDEREFMGWLVPGAEKFSVTALFVSKLMLGKKFDLGTSTNGSPRAIVPIGLYEKVVPFDIEPTFLLKALVMGDIERAEELGVLELDEEDVALCSFVCPGKEDYGTHLRDTLTTLEKEG